MARSLVLILLVAVLVPACQRPAPTGGSGSGCNGIMIDWVDFIVVGATQYTAGMEGTPTVSDADLGPVVAHVKFKVDGNVCDPQYKPKDGDAAFLEPGTPIYAVTGRPSDKILAARHDGTLVAYTALPRS
jgi:hypothetical protein